MLFSEGSFAREEKYFCSNHHAINVNFYSVCLRPQGPGEKGLGEISSPAFSSEYYEGKYLSEFDPGPAIITTQ